MQVKVDGSAGDGSLYSAHGQENRWYARLGKQACKSRSRRWCAEVWRETSHVQRGLGQYCTQYGLQGMGTGVRADVCRASEAQTARRWNLTHFLSLTPRSSRIKPPLLLSTASFPLHYPTSTRDPTTPSPSPNPLSTTLTMRYIAPICAVLAAVALASDVHELKKDTFKAFVEENDLVLAECEFSIALTDVLLQFQS
jgi:hypothetical protein